MSLTMPLGVCYTPYGMTEDGQNEMTPMTGSDIVCGLIAIAVFAVLFLVIMWFAAPYLAPYWGHLP